MMRNFTLKYFKQIDAKESDTLAKKLNDSPESNFDGIFDEKNFQERYARENENRQVLELDGYFKTELKEWQSKYDKKSLVDSQAIDLYPYVDGVLYDNNKYFIAIVVTERDENYIDDKTEDINKVFECSMFIYQNENETIKAQQLVEFNESLRFYLGRFVNNCSLYKLQKAMNGAIGEAADISRHWYSKGLDSIFNKETVKEFENDENSINFYTKFIKELLCKIDGVKDTEIYPFDRVFIFPETGLENNFDGIRKIRVLEAKIKSREPFDRGNYLMGWEQDVEDEDGNRVLDEANDLIFSDKQINYMDWNIEKSDVFKTVIATSDKKDIRGNLLLSNLLLEKEFLDKTMKDKTGADNKKLVNMKRKIRDQFNEYGLYYEYEFGLKLNEQFKALFELQEKYFNEMKQKKKNVGVEYNEKTYHYNLRNGKYRDVALETLIDKMKESIKDEYKAKTITVCFDPERITKPELAEAAKYLKRKDSITMVFVADKDIVKTTSELEAEIKDFEVLIQMLIRQIIYNTENAAKEADMKKKVFSVADSALHDAKASAEGHSEIQKKINDLIIQVRQKLNTADASTSGAVSFESANVFNELLNRFFNNASALSKPVDLEMNVNEWLPSDHNVSITLHESFLPKMKMSWDNLSISTSFKVLLKNATEYCRIYAKTSNDTKLTLSMSMESLNNMDFLVVNIINTTPALTKSRFDMLNNDDLDGLGKDNAKEGSTGIGVVSSKRMIKSISSFNKITFAMLSSNVISAKMYLKVDLLPDDSMFLDEVSTPDETSATTRASEPNSYDVVYFEDSSAYYDVNVPLLEKYNVSVFHSVRKDETHMAEAKLLLTDMQILNSDDKDDKEEGLEAILLFKTRNKTAPICVLSNGEPRGIKNDILGHLDGMIGEDDIIVIEDFNATLEAGKIFILSEVKTLNDTHSIVFDYLRSIAKVEEKIEIPNTRNYEDAPFVSKGEYTPEFGSLFSKLEKDISHKHFYVATSSNSEMELSATLTKWLAYKTSRPNKSADERPVSNVTYHKNTLLIIDDVSLKDERERWWLFYLGVTHNVIFNFLAKPHPDIMSQWSEVAVKRESSGYLGKLRHDVKNYQKIYEKIFSGSNLNKEFEKIIKATLELQKLLQLSKYESLKHFSLIPGVQKLQGKAPSHANEDVWKYTHEVEKITREIQLSLKTAIGIMGGEAKKSANINNLRLFKRLVDFNIEFCTDNKQVSA